MSEEQVLFIEMQKGNWTAFNFFFKEYIERLYLYAFAFVKKKDVAEDIVQEAFIYLWTNRSRLTYNGPVSAYLMRSVKNACVNYRLHSEVERKYQHEVLVNSSEIVEDADDMEEIRQKILETVDKLPQKCREIFILGCVEGLKYREIADKLDISVNTVKTQMKFAYRKIKADAGIDSVLLIIFISGMSDLFLKK